ncbi:MAG: hypothetical protein U9R75_06965 [Candidatus Thermoplasmatota archaeon]|nr:hypothetical protein [Candidatus Thermoplasmatota archaeon]
MRKFPGVLVFILTLIVASPFLSTGSTGDEHTSDIVTSSKMSRSVQNGGTAIDIIPEDMSMFSTWSNLSTDDGKAWELEKNLLVEDHSFVASSPSGQGSQGSRSIISNNEAIFLAFTRGGAPLQYLSFWITRYDISLDHWEVPLLVENFTGPFLGHPEMKILKNDLFYIMPVTSSDPSESSLHAVRAPVKNWFWMSNSTVNRLDIDGNVQGSTDSMIWGQALVVLWTEAVTGDLMRSTWEGGAWGDASVVMSDVGVFSLLKYNYFSSNRALLFHSTGTLKDVNVSYTTTGGLTWSPDSRLNVTIEGISSISSTSFGGRLFASAVHRQEGWSRIFYSDNGLDWSRSITVIPVNGNAPDSVFEAQISADRSQVILTLETGGAVELHASDNSGLTFDLVQRFEDGSEDPVQCSEKRLVGIFVNGELKTYRLKASNDGKMLTVPLSPMGVNSWNDIGLDVYGNGPGSFCGMRIWNRHGNAQLFPETGWFDLSTLDGGQLNDISFRSIGQLTGDWRSGAGLQGSIRLEFRIVRSEDNIPAISRILLNYSTAFPFSDNLQLGENIPGVVNCSKTGSGYMLDDGHTSGEIIIGPVEKELEWCDLISIKTSSISSKVAYRIEILGRDLEPITGFEMARSLELTGTSVTGYMRWDRSFLCDLPSSIDIIFVRVRITSGVTNGRPTVESLSFIYSEAPTLGDMEIENTEVLRGEGTTFYLTASDRDEPMEHLLVDIEYKGPNDEQWRSEMIKGQILDGSRWAVPFVTEHTSDPGRYSFRLTITDSMGVSSTHDLEMIVDVQNNRPLEAFAYINTDRVRSGDEVEIIVYTPGSDIETSVDELTYTFVSRRDNLIFEELNMTELTTYVIPEGVVRKDEIWNISIYTNDGIEDSHPFDLSFIVENSPPVIHGAPVNMTILEDSIPALFDPNLWFMDNDGDPLEFEYNAGSGLNLTASGNGFTLASEENANGETLLEITASDGSASVSHMIEVTVEPTNDPPFLFIMGDLTLAQGETTEYFISAFDITDGEEVTVTHDIQQKVPGIADDNFMQMKNGSFVLHATNEMIGTFHIEVFATDGTETVNETFDLTIINSNDPPTTPIISISPEMNVLVGDGAVTLTANATDPDLKWGDELTFTWSSDIQGELGTGNSIELTLQEGAHLITVEVADDTGETRSSTISVEVTGTVTGTGTVMRTATLLQISVLTGTLIGILLGAVIFILARKRRKGKEEEDKKELERKDDRDKGDEPLERKDGGPEEKKAENKPLEQLDNGGGGEQEKTNDTIPEKADNGDEIKGGEKHE